LGRVPQSGKYYPTGSPGCPLGVSGTGNSSRLVPQQAVSPESLETAEIATPFGRLVVSASDGFLTGIDFAPESGAERPVSNAVLRAAVSQLAGYFEDPNTRFSLPLRLAGTEYMRRVWAALIEISPGRTETYGSLARRLGTGPRAVAAACRANAFPIVIPCHRVVAAHGLGGYSGQISGPMLEVKRWLLKHEGCPLA
jgi:methylated-DNA-[protein]-cysteine S-methyltransferase